MGLVLPAAMLPRRRLALAIAALFLAGACTTAEIGAFDDRDPSVPTGDDLRPGGGDAGVGQEVERPPIYEGRYELTSIVDLAGTGLFGEVVSGTLIQLSRFHEHPAATILNLMAIYEVPYYTQVWNIIPGFLKGLVTNELDKLIVNHVFQNVPAIDKAAQVIDDVASVSRNVELVTELTLRGPNAAGQMRGEHTMKGLGFKLWTWHATIPLPTEFNQLTQLEVRASLEPRDFPDGRGALLDLSRQNFAIPYGNMLMDALRDAVFKPAGATNLGGYLNKIFSCPSIAQSLGDVCVLGACLKDVVSVSDMTRFCQSGFSILGLVVETSVRALQLDLVDLSNGKCVMYDKGYEDTAGDGKMHAISDGTWDMAIKMGSESRTVKSPFEGRRIGDL
jgi:hypothetical protein